LYFEGPLEIPERISHLEKVLNQQNRVNQRKANQTNTDHKFFTRITSLPEGGITGVPVKI